jgi:hypothetical protein
MGSEVTFETSVSPCRTARSYSTAHLLVHGSSYALEASRCPSGSGHISSAIAKPDVSGELSVSVVISTLLSNSLGRIRLGWRDSSMSKRLRTVLEVTQKVEDK